MTTPLIAIAAFVAGYFAWGQIRALRTDYLNRKPGAGPFDVAVWYLRLWTLAIVVGLALGATRMRFVGAIPLVLGAYLFTVVALWAWWATRWEGST